MKRWRQLNRIISLRIWDCFTITRRLKYSIYKRMLKLENDIHLSSNVMIYAHHGDGGGISIGKDCIINDNVSIDISGKVIIGNGVVIAQDVIIYTHYHKEPNKPDEHTQTTKLIIEDHVFLGARSIVLASCHHIGKNSIIGAGAVVTKDIPDNAVVVGVPAHIIKYKES